MVKFVSHPNVEELLPPFLAHIPVAFSSSQAPPSLLPLLSPILRQRVRLLAGGEPSSNGSAVTESWLPLLTWSKDGAILAQKLASQDFEPHPSGEVEIGDYNFKGIQRTDRETLKASVELNERDIEVIYTWVTEDDEGAGWRIMDVKVSSDGDEGDYKRRGSENAIVDRYAGADEAWYSTVSAADLAFFQAEEKQAVAAIKGSVPAALKLKEEEEDDDAAYWAQYDQTPARTPAVNHFDRANQPSEDEYFARYSTVSPALDNAPDTPVSPSTTAPSNFASLNHTLPPLQTSTFSPFAVPISPPTSSPRSKPSSPPTELSYKVTETTTTKPVSPRPTSPSSSTRASIAKLERKASIAVQAEVAIKQHISAQLKSLYRLSKGSGIDQEEFKRIVATELEILQMVDEDDANEGSQEGW